MARSHSIYILTDRASGEPIGAFTVKHEMEAARRRHGKSTDCDQYRDNWLYGPEKDCNDDALRPSRQ